MNKEAVKLYADLILEKSLVITPYESNNDISFKYEHNSIIATIIKKNMYNFKHEYDDFTILRDETYTSYYESLIKLITKENYTYEQMDEIIDDFETQKQKITQTFIKLLIGYTNNLLKAHLIDHTRKDQSNNEHITTRTIYNDELLENIPNEESNESEIDNPLYNLLTESEKQYVLGEKVYESKSVEKSTKSRIKRRIEKMSDERIKEILDAVETEQEIIDNILDIEDTDEFIRAIRKEQDKEWFADLLVAHVPGKHRRDFNNNNITKETIMEYRKALHKSLGR